MAGTAFKGLVALCIALFAAYLALRGAPWTVVVRGETAGWAEIARTAGIRNLVTLIYLGPRMVDTVFEVMVVVLAVVGMRHITEEP
jgi:multisubunit Na+/H+ antiporter MnhB subunit